MCQRSFSTAGAISIFLAKSDRALVCDVILELIEGQKEPGQEPIADAITVAQIVKSSSSH